MKNVVRLLFAAARLAVALALGGDMTREVAFFGEGGVLARGALSACLRAGLRPSPRLVGSTDPSGVGGGTGGSTSDRGTCCSETVVEGNGAGEAGCAAPNAYRGTGRSAGETFGALLLPCSGEGE